MIDDIHYFDDVDAQVAAIVEKRRQHAAGLPVEQPRLVDSAAKPEGGPVTNTQRDNLRRPATLAGQLLPQINKDTGDTEI